MTKTERIVHKIPNYILKPLMFFNMFCWIFIIGIHYTLKFDSCITLFITTLYLLGQFIIVLPLSRAFCYHPDNAYKFICLPMIAAFIITIKNITPVISILESSAASWIKTTALILDSAKYIYLIILSFMILKSIAAWFTQLYND
ncbi:hypothetical protein [Butyrivibrio fibrisolvens]|uniref:hypothetical protein n=1 Tax=Butyrivibrio fibrisolvens TaxID=831 RepID=UPI0003B6F2CF|nr:hypothetical protein [Butyrivibrio fibrisolvens]